MVSKAREDLPDPERPVTTVSVLRGMWTLMSRRLCWRAPRTEICVIAMEEGDFGSKPARESCRESARLSVAKRNARARIGKDNPFGILFGNRKAGQRLCFSVKNDIGTISCRLRSTASAHPIRGSSGDVFTYAGCYEFADVDL